jgi:hypothetical protein
MAFSVFFLATLRFGHGRRQPPTLFYYSYEVFACHCHFCPYTLTCQTSKKFRFGFYCSWIPRTITLAAKKGFFLYLVLIQYWVHLIIMTNLHSLGMRCTL